MECLMGIDIGTSSLKTVIVDPDGNILATAAKEYTFDSIMQGYAEQDPDVWWQALAWTVKKALLECKIAAKDIKGIGFSGQMHGMVAMDKDGKALRKAILHCDVRSSYQADKIKACFPEGTLDKILFNPVFPGMQLVSLLWVRDNEPEIFEKISTVVCPKDYIRYLLTGEIGTERTDASSTNAYDMERQDFSEVVLDTLKISRGLFPDADNLPYEIAGTVCKKASEETGLLEGTPVVYGGGDQSMQSLGNGLIKSGDMMVTIGTSGQALMLTDHLVVNPELNTHTFAHVHKDMWFGLGAMLNAGVTLNWFKRSFMKEYSYKDLSDMAEGIKPGSEELLFFPAMMGERTPYMDADTRGIFIGFSFLHTPAHFARAIMEGVSFQLKTGVNKLVEMYGRPEYIVAAGGATNSPVWLQIQADMYNIPLCVKSSDEQACLGAAISAGVGCGIYKNAAEGCDRAVPKIKKMIEPDKDNAKLYDEIYNDIYLKLYSQNESIFKALKKRTVK